MVVLAVEPKPVKYIWLLKGFEYFYNPNHILLQVKQLLGNINNKYFLDILNVKM